MAEPAIELRVGARVRDLGDGFHVRRSLPTAARRMVGPFIFLDHFGPLTLPVGHGMDVRPHPHIGLATVTYLLDGEIVHRDSLGSLQTIRPGDVNWMTAGRGIVHSERSSPQQRSVGPRLHGLQAWVALPTEHEETEPTFDHYPVATLPAQHGDGVRLRVIAGAAYGLTSPVRALSPLFYADAQLDAGAALDLPGEHPERALYVVAGQVSCDGATLQTGELAVLRPGVSTRATAHAGSAHLMLLGGAPVDGERHIDWNFVSSRRDRIDRAKDDWKAQRFPKVPGDEVEFIPLPPR